MILRNKTFQAMSVHAKLAIVLTLLSTTLVLSMAVLFIGDKILSFRTRMVENHRVLCRTIGANSVAALLFDDTLSAEHLLASLDGVRDVMEARLYTAEGRLFARYLRDQTQGNSDRRFRTLLQSFMEAGGDSSGLEQERYEFHDGVLDMVSEVRLDNKVVGYIEIRGNLERLYKRMQLSIVVVIGLVILLAVFVQLLSYRMQQFIARPLDALLQSVKAVTRKKDYTFRVSKFHDDEFGELTDGFNEMLEELERRDRELQRHGEDLEKLVAQRTSEIQRAHKQLQEEMEAKREVQDRLARAERMEAIGTLAAGVAHDLNNILSGVVSYPELLLMKLPEEHELRAPLASIQASGQKAAAIVQDLLTLSRRGASVMEPVDLDKVVDTYLGSAEFAKLKSGHPHLRIERQWAGKDFTIVGSAVHLGKVVMNLVTNSMEAMAKPGAVTICLDRVYLDTPVEGYDSVAEGEYVRLRVSDEGHGISGEDLRFIFEPFYTKKKMGMSGTGLGMTVVWGTVQDHDGYIDVRSRVGKGTTFSLYFPATSQTPHEDAIHPPGEFSGRGQRILVVDDLEDQRTIASSILEELHYRPEVAESGEQAVEMVRKAKYDLLLLDMVMEPGIDGLETYRQAIAIDGDLKAVIASGYAESHRVQLARRMGIRNLVRKPYTISGLARSIHEELSRPVEVS